MCFSPYWFVSLLVWLIVLGAFVAVLRLIVPWALTTLGVQSAPMIQAINIIIGAAVLIAVIWFLFDLLNCAPGFGARLRGG